MSSTNSLFPARATLALGLCLVPCAFEGAERAADAQAAASSASWQQVGWGGGAFYIAAAWHPTNEKVLYMASDCAGLYRTEDQAMHWRLANAGITNYCVPTLAVSAADPNLVYALTEGALQKSTDAAKTWQVIPDSEKLGLKGTRNGSVQAVAIHPSKAAIVYVGSRTGQLFKTADGGKSWTELAYRDAMPKPPVEPSYLGTGALVLAYAAEAAGMDTQGRTSNSFGGNNKPLDWSAYKKLSVHVRLPEGAPVLQASLAIQSGSDWKWQQGPWMDVRSGEWSEAALDLTALSGLDAVRMVHVNVHSPNAAWKGDILVDAVCLHTQAAGSLAPGQKPDGTDTHVLSDWEKIGDPEGWAANTQFKDSLHVTAARQSQKKTGGDVLSSISIPVTEEDSVYVSNTAMGIFRSPDAGVTWMHLDAPPTVSNVTVSATDPQIVWSACGAKGLWRSKDRGTTWTQVVDPSFGAAHMRQVVLTATKPDRVYAIGEVAWNGFLYRSDDAGATWTRTNSVRTGIPGNPTIPEETGSGAFAKGFSGLSKVTQIAVNPNNPDELFISGNWRNVYSGDGGKTMEERSTGADNTCATDIQFLDGKTYVTAMDEGLMVSDNDGGEWRQLIPLKYDDNISGHFWRVRVTRVGDATRIVTTSSPWQSYADPKCANRAYVSDDGGKTFAKSAAGLPDYVSNVNCMWGRSFPRALAADPKNPDVLYMGMDGDPEPAAKLPGGGIFRSKDGGKSWTRCAGQPGGLRMFYGLVVDPTDTKRLFYSCCGSGGGAWRSVDEGATWEQVFTAEPWSFNLEVAPSGMILVGGNNLHQSVDHGKTWKTLTSFKDDPTIVGIAVDPANEQRMWISRTTWDSSSRGGIFRTVDGGATWEDITGDIGYRKPQLLRYNPVTHDLWAGGAPLFKVKQ